MAGMSSYVNPREELDDIDDIIRPLLQGGHGIQGGVANELFGEGPSAGQEHHIEVHVLDLKDIYDKVQKKTAHGSEQHVSNGVVNIEITTTAQVSKIVVFVRRCERAAEKTNDTIGAVELPVTLRSCTEPYKIRLFVDLDAVYKTQSGLYVYWLDRVEVEERNIWELVIVIEFIDETHKIIQSRPFRIRTKPRSNPKNQDLPTEMQQPSTGGNGATCNSNHSTNNEDDPLITPPHKRKRSSFSASSYGTNPSPFSPFSNSPGSFSTDNDVGGPSSIRTSETVVTDYLEAQRAHIQHLKVHKLISSSNADIAYHLKLQDHRKQKLEEGDIVGFFPNKETGATEIALLSLDNSEQARMAGVISRSAYLHGNVPEVDEGLTDTVCVIGIVKVKIAGPVQNGERIYASIDRPGIGIPETQFSFRSAGKCSAILLGQSLEAVHSPSLQVVKCVKCFVSIVLGIQSGQVFSALEDVRLYTRNKIAESIKREKKKFYRGLICKASIILILLSLVTAVLYEVFVPGSWFRYLLCRRGCIAHHNMWFTFSTDDHQTAKVHGIEFEWLVLKRRMDLHFNKYPNATGMHYYLNLERCAYGGIVPVKSHLDHTPQVRGAEVFVVDPSCSRVFFEQNAKWHIYGTAVDFKCEPPYK